MAPLLAPPGPAQYPLSQLGLAAELPVGSILRRVSEQVPSILAKEVDRPVGAPGRATYTVKRGDFQLGLENDHLGLFVPVSADITVCKPLGGVCLRYGHCTPAFDVHFSMSALVGADYVIRPPRGTLSASRKCVIGLDVTDQLESIAKRELSKVQGQIAAQWPNTSKEVRNLWQDLAAPLRVTPIDCLLFEGSGVSYTPPNYSKDGTHIDLDLGIEGRLLPASSCTQEHSAAPLPAPKVRKRPLRQSNLWIPELIATAPLSKGMEEKLGGRWSAFPADTLEVREVRFGTDRVALLLNLHGRICQPLWVEAKLRMQKDQGLTLHEPRLLTLPGATLRQDATDDLRRHLSEARLYASQGATWTSVERIKALLSEWRGMVPDEVQLDLSVQDPKPTRVQISQEGILLLHSIRARLAVKDV